MSHDTVGHDFRASELLVAAATAVLVASWCVLAVGFATFGRRADAPAIVPIGAVPIRVIPVLDLDSPLLKLGGKRVRAKMPDRWLRKAPVKPTERKAHVSTKAKADVASIVPTTIPLSDAGSAPPTDAAAATPPDAAVGEPSDGGGSGESAAGSPDGGKIDKLRGRAERLYASRIQGFFKRGFHHSCPGLSADEKKKRRAVAGVKVGSDGTVLSYSLAASGNADLDSASKQAMDRLVGQQVPPPPENYPDFRRNYHSVTFVCR